MTSSHRSTMSLSHLPGLQMMRHVKGTKEPSGVVPTGHIKDMNTEMKDNECPTYDLPFPKVKPVSKATIKFILITVIFVLGNDLIRQPRLALSFHLSEYWDCLTPIIQNFRY